MSRSHRPLLVAAATTLALLSQVHAQAEDADPCLGIAPAPGLTL